MRDFGFNMIVGTAALLLAVMGVFAAVGFACLSLYLYLIAFTTGPLAALATGFAALLFALVVALAGKAFTSRPARRGETDERDVLGGLEDAIQLGRALGLESRTFMTTHLSKAAIAVFGLGFAMGLSPRLRKLITDLLSR